MNETILKDIKHGVPDEFIVNWDYIEVDDRHRVYYKQVDEIGHGVYFYAVANDGFEINEYTKENEWHPDYCIVQCVFKGIAYFDGIRHLYLGDVHTKNQGYSFYPCVETMIDILKVIRGLEIKYCRDHE